MGTDETLTEKRRRAQAASARAKRIKNQDRRLAELKARLVRDAPEFSPKIREELSAILRLAGGNE